MESTVIKNEGENIEKWVKWERSMNTCTVVRAQDMRRQK
jgi:hypothetical protein